MITTLCYLEKDNKYLMLHRTKKENDINKNKWLGVGGKLEKNETPQQCLFREVKEETGLTLIDYIHRGIVIFNFNDDEPLYMYLYTSKNFVGEVQECSEGDLKSIDKSENSFFTLNFINFSFSMLSFPTSPINALAPSRVVQCPSTSIKA